MSIVIVGAGPNLGAAIARRFGREEMPVGLVSRNREKLERLAEDLRKKGSLPTSRPRTSATPPRSRWRSARWAIASARSKCWSTRLCPRASS